MKYTRLGLIAALENGAKFDYELFWGGPCSQWAYSPFKADDLWFPTAEHFMMYHKAHAFGDMKAVERILLTEDPAEAKAIGRLVKGYDDSKWAALRYNLVKRGNLAKFGQNAVLLEELLATGDKVIVEASPYDTIWGIGMDETDPRCRDPHQWNGENLLGFVCMEVRDELRPKP